MNIKLVNMPFALPAVPSLALAQLESVVNGHFAGAVAAETVYLNMDFALELGDLTAYHLPHTATGFMTGLGDWFFRQAAFPDAVDNTTAFLARYTHERTPATRCLRDQLLPRRPDVPAFIDRMIDIHGLLDADLVGCTALFSQTTASLALLRRLKERKPSIVAVIGGACCEGAAGQALAVHAETVDYVFSGPALISFNRLLGTLLAGDAEACHRIHGVFTRQNQQAGPGVNLVGDDLDIHAGIEPDYHAFLDRFERLFGTRDLRPALYFETSRGCPRAGRNACSFCGLNGLDRHYRTLAPDRARRQIDHMLSYHPRARCFIATDNLMPRHYIRDVLAPLTPPADALIKYEVRPDLKDAEIATLCRAGVRLVQPGVEALSTQSLQLMRKGVTAFGNLAFLKRCARHPFEIEWNLLVFSPGEPEATYEGYLRLIPRLTHLPPPAGAYPIMFTRCSRYLDDPEAFGLRLQPQDFYGLTFPFPPEAIRQMAFHFVDTAADQERINGWLDRLGAAVGHWRQRWYNTDHQEASRLCFTGPPDAPAIYDSRDGTAAEYPLSARHAALLDMLDSPAGVEDLASRTGDTGKSLAGDLAFLGERGLLFEEDSRLLSLVIRH